ncbi:MAG: hypothetical protein R3A80_08330 [Bdellovibrionota bacterium]
MSSELKSHGFVEYSFDFKRVGYLRTVKGSGTLLLRETGAFLLDVNVPQEGRYVLRYEHEVLAELIQSDKKTLYKVYSSPQQLELSFAFVALKNLKYGVRSAITTLRDKYNVTLKGSEFSLKPKIETEILKSLEIKQEDGALQLSLSFRSGDLLTQDVFITAVLSKKVVDKKTAAQRFILDIPANASVLKAN